MAISWSSPSSEASYNTEIGSSVTIGFDFTSDVSYNVFRLVASSNSSAISCDYTSGDFENRSRATGSFSATATEGVTNGSITVEIQGRMVSDWVTCATRTIYVSAPKHKTSISVSGTSIECWPGVSQGPSITYESSYVTLSGDLSKIHVGNYSFTATIKNTNICEWDDGTTAPKTYNWSIYKHTIGYPTMSPNPAQYVYDGKSHFPTFTYGGYCEYDTSYTYTAQTAVGNYRTDINIKSDYKDDCEFHDGSWYKTFNWSIISSPQATFDPAPEAIPNLKYNGSEQPLITSGTAKNGTARYKLGSGGLWSSSVPTATNPGTYTVYAKVVGNSGYDDSGEIEKTATISKGDSFWTQAPAPVSAMYSGEAIELVVPGTPNAGTAVYSTDNINFSTTIPTATAINTYIVYYKILESTYYAEGAQGQVISKIQDAVYPEIFQIQISENAIYDIRDAREIPATLTGDEAPTESTIGVEGQKYIVSPMPGTSNYSSYICMGQDSGSGNYIWKELKIGASEIPQVRTEIITTSQDYVVPEHTGNISVRIFGGGGGGIGAKVGGYELYGAGGGGGCMETWSGDIATGVIVPVTIGTAGMNAIPPSTAATNGGASSFGTYVTANGGGAGWYGGNGKGGNGGTGGGGVVSGGDAQYGGGGGAYSSQPGNGGTYGGGGGTGGTGGDLHTRTKGYGGQYGGNGGIYVISEEPEDGVDTTGFMIDFEGPGLAGTSGVQYCGGGGGYGGNGGGSVTKGLETNYGGGGGGGWGGRGGDGHPAAGGGGGGYGGNGGAGYRDYDDGWCAYGGYGGGYGPSNYARGGGVDGSATMLDPMPGICLITYIAGESPSIEVVGDILSSDTVYAEKDDVRVNGVWRESENPNPLSHDLPNDYEEVESITLGGSSQCWIQLGVTCKSTLRVQIGLTVEAMSGGNILGNSGTGESDSYRFFGYQNQWYLDFGSGSGYNRIYGGTLSTNTHYDIEIGNRYVKNLATDENIISGTTVADFVKSYTMEIGGTTEINKYDYVTVYDGDTLTNQFIPCKRISDNLGGVYDVVTHEFHPVLEGTTYTLGDPIPKTIHKQYFDIAPIPSYGTWVVTTQRDSTTVTYPVLVNSNDVYVVNAAWYNYGDGTLNTVVAGYNNVYYSTDDINFQHYTMNMESGGSNIYTTNLSSSNLQANRTFHKPSAGHNSIAYTVDATNEDMTFMAYGFYQGYTPSTQLSNFEIVIDGSAHSLKYCVEHGLIKPIVLIGAVSWVSNPLNLYYGQGYMSDGGWPEWNILFMINKGHVMTALNCDFTVVGSGATDGWNLSYCPTSQHRVVVSY